MAGDAVTVAPDQYKVLLENDRVRVLETRYKPGDKSEMHSHPDLIGVLLDAGSFKFTFPDGQTMDIELGKGEVRYFDAHEHAVENVGNTESHVILIELK